MDASYYDEVSRRWTHHYTQHHKWFPLMLLIAQRIRMDHIVDLGCGAGHMAELLKDWGYNHYTGIDFSDGMLDVAKRRGLGYGFINLDLESDRWIDRVGTFNTVISIELLEHVDSDLMILEQIPEGKHCLLATTNEPGKEHVRHFKNKHTVMRRYGHLFSAIEIRSFKNMWIPHWGFQIFYVIDAIRGKHEEA